MLISKGVQLIKHKNKSTKETILKYRVQINRKDFKLDKLFDTLEEAQECVNLAKSDSGRNSLLVRSEKRTELDNIFKTQSLDHWFAKYIELYIPEVKQTGVMLERELILKQRNRVAKLSFIKNILNCEVPDRLALDKFKKEGVDEEKYSILKDYIKFGNKRIGDFKPQELTYLEINDYIRERLKKIQKVSVLSEISMISNLYKKLKHMSNQFVTLVNPTIDYDKSLVKNAVNKSGFRFDEKELILLLNELKAMKNPETYNISMLSLLTTMRKSECCLLEWSRVFLDEGYILLKNTKSGKPRKVYLIEEARAFIRTLPRQEGVDEVFKFKIYGYDRNFNRIREKLNLQHLKIHYFRKEGISRLIENMAKNGDVSSIYLGGFLGMVSQSKLQNHIDDVAKPNIDNQSDILKSVGHAHASTTADFYYQMAKPAANDRK